MVVQLRDRCMLGWLMIGPAMFRPRVQVQCAPSVEGLGEHAERLNLCIKIFQHGNGQTRGQGLYHGCS
jgi:hypothetical protein